VTASGRSPRALALATAALTLAACLAIPGGFYAARARRYAALDLVLEGDFPIRRDDVVGFVPAPNAASLRRHPRAGLAYHVFTSDRGARVAAAGERTPPSVDLMAVGCSFTWGHGVEAQETYTALLAHRLGVRAANFAFSAYGTVQSEQLLERNLDLRARVVVYGLIQDHVKRNLSACAPVYGPTCLPSAYVDFDASGAPFIHPPPAAAYDFNARFWDAFFFHRASWPRRIALAAEADVRRALAHPPEDRGDPEARRRSLTFLLARMRAAAAQAGAHLVVVYIPYLERGGTNPPPPAIAAALRSIGGDVTVVDLSPAVARYYADVSRPLLRFERDRHPAPAGHALIADALEPVVRGLLGR
jgi:hypothetical protein